MSACVSFSIYENNTKIIISVFEVENKTTRVEQLASAASSSRDITHHRKQSMEIK
jgi:hypothetical protein